MRAYVMQGPGQGQVADVAEPTIGEYDALVEMVVCGVCSSTDRMLRRGTFGGVAYPSILGHEAVGRLVELGRRVRHLPLGSLVTRPSAYQPEQAPLHMHWGGMAERGVVTDWQALQEDHPDHDARSKFSQVYFDEVTDPESVAVSISLSETFSVICREDVLAKTVAVVGTGIAGLSFVRYAKLLGAATVIAVGRRHERLNLAKRLGADRVVLSAGDAAERIAAEHGGVDVAFEASGSAAMIGRAYGWLKRGGRAVVYSAPDEPSSINMWGGPRNAQLTVASTNEAAVLPQVVELTAAGVLDKNAFVTHRYPFTEAARAFAEIDRHADVVKALLTFEQRR